MYQRYIPCYYSISLIALSECNQSREAPLHFLTNSYEGQRTTWHEQIVTKGGILLKLCTYCASGLHVVLDFTRGKKKIKSQPHSSSGWTIVPQTFYFQKKLTPRGRCLGLCFYLISLHPQSTLILCKLPRSCTA